MRLVIANVGYLPSHVERALMEKLLNVHLAFGDYLLNIFNVCILMCGNLVVS